MSEPLEPALERAAPLIVDRFADRGDGPLTIAQARAAITADIRQIRYWADRYARRFAAVGATPELALQAAAGDLDLVFRWRAAEREGS